MADLETLLSPVSDDAPVGPDLSYDDGRIQIESEFESSFSDQSERSADTNWSSVIGAIENQCSQTKDIWLAIYLMRAGAFAGQLETVEKGAGLLAGLLDRYWEQVHPQLDEYGLQGRVGPCLSLCGIPEFIGPLRRMAIVTHPRLGTYSSADLERFASEGSDADGYGMFRAAIADMAQDDIVAILDRLDGIAASLTAVDGVFTMHADGEGPSLGPCHDAVAQIRKALAVYGPQPEAASDDADAGFHDGGVSQAPASGGGGRPGRVDSREDVIAAIDSIADYYRRREPSSPVPLVLQRARQWVALDFLAILEDIVPDSVSAAGSVLSYRAGDAASSGWAEE